MQAEDLSVALDWRCYERCLILSPHMDDAVLSCSELIRSCRSKTLFQIVTFFCADPGTSTKQHGIELPAQRRIEDRRACQFLNVSFIQLGYWDAIYRHDQDLHQALYPKLDQVFGQPHPGDRSTLEEIQAVLTRFCSGLGRMLIISPMGLGMHVDHQLVAQAALKVARQTQDLDLLFYEDFPYVVDQGTNIGRPDDQNAALARLNVKAEKTMAIRSDPQHKLSSIRLYTSQQELLFKTPKHAEQIVRARLWQGQPAEYYWSVSS